MFVDAGVIGPILSTTRVDLLFCQSNKHQSNMTFDRFLDTLPKMALLIFDRLSPQEAMLALITNHLNSLYENIMEKTDLGKESEVTCLWHFLSSKVLSCLLLLSLSKSTASRSCNHFIQCSKRSTRYSLFLLHQAVTCFFSRHTLLGNYLQVGWYLKLEV